MTAQDENDWKHAMQDILKTHRADLDRMQAEIDGLREVINSARMLIALARGPHKARTGVGGRAKAVSA